MEQNCSLPPVPYQHAVLKRIYPWDEYDRTLVLQWLFKWAKKTGFHGSLEDFKLRYGTYVETTDPQDIYDLIDTYEGTYHITPLVSIEQVLQTKNKILNNNIVIDPIPADVLNTKTEYRGNYKVTPMAHLSQILRTNDKIMTDNVVVEPIPYYETTNDAGGYTVIIG